jgi:rhodanese-related sulfurtransferase
MIGRAVVQGACIGAVALAIGTVHSLIKPVKSWESERPLAPVEVPAPKPAQPVLPAPGGDQPAPVVPTPPAIPAVPRDDRMVSLARFKELMSGSLPLQIVDAREPGEYSAGRIAGAINIPPGEFFGKVPDAVNQRLVRDLPVVVYCSGGNCDASKLVAMRLKDLGFAQTFVYDDGYNGWVAAGEAVEK